jgi:heptosyltransferase-2
MRHARHLGRLIASGIFLLGWIGYSPIRWRRRAELRARRPIRKVVVLNAAAGLGNIVLLTALLHNLRRFYRNARIVVVMPPAARAHDILGELADQIVFLDPAAGRWALLSFAWRVLRPQRFDLALATFFSPTVRISWVLALGRCRYRVAYAADRLRGFLNTETLVDRRGHEVDRHLRLLEWKKEPRERRIAAAASSAELDHCRRVVAECGLGIDRPLLGIHPGCDRPNALKRWPLERFVSTITRLTDSGIADALVFLGPGETDLYPTLARELRGRALIVTGEPLAHIVALIGRCDAFLSNDSGLMHVAAALGVPVIGIFGPTAAEKNAPVGTATILTAAGVACRPCHVTSPISCPHERRYCLEGISVDEVVRSVRAALRRPVETALTAPGYADASP